MSKNAKIVAVSGNTQTAGAIVWWNMHETTDYDALSAAWKDAGLDAELLPRLPSPEAALRRAVKQEEGKHLLVRGIENGWALVDEEVDGEDLDYEIRVRFTLNAVGNVNVEPKDHKLAAPVKAEYDKLLSTLSREDVSSWLVRMAALTQAVMLRENGGFYFIPRTQLDQWRRIAKAVTSASQHRVNEIPALQSEEAVAAILEAVTAEAEKAADEMDEDMDDAKLGARALSSRTNHAESVLKKVMGYEALLGEGLDKIRERLEGLKAGFAAKAIKAMADSEAA
jgi:phage pi2 protein 07